MGIKFRCQACDKKLHVKSFLAGKRGVCPKCGATIRIPLHSDATLLAADEEASAVRHPPSSGSSVGRSAVGHAPQREAPSVPAARPAVRPRAPVASSPRVSDAAGGGTSVASDPITEAPDAVWYVRPPTGGQFGPADGAIMRRWLEDGRVSADALVWREGWPAWKIAGPVFPSLEISPRQAPESAPAVPVDPPSNGEFALAADRPVAARRAPHVRSKRVGRNVAIILALALACVGLVIALYVVLRGQG
ncbi:MAG: DUF4339 domain-containing protein [Pirellulaceae bacterium]